MHADLYRLPSVGSAHLPPKVTYVCSMTQANLMVAANIHCLVLNLPSSRYSQPRAAAL